MKSRRKQFTHAEHEAASFFEPTKIESKRADKGPISAEIFSRFAPEDDPAPGLFEQFEVGGPRSGRHHAQHGHFAAFGHIAQ